MKEISLVSLVVLTQVIMIPFFLEFNINAKMLFFSLVFLFLFFIDKNRKIQVSILNYLFVIIIFLFLSSAFLSEYFFTSTLLVLSLFVFLVYTSIYLPIKFEKKEFITYFFSGFQFFIVIAACFGLYEYSTFSVLGKSHGALIPYLVPASKGLRVAGIYGQPNLFALLLVTGIFVFLYQHLHNRNIGLSRFPKLNYLPLLTVSVVFFMTGSRAGLLAFLITFLLLIWLIARKCYLKGDKEKFKKFIQLTCVFLIAFGISYGLNCYMTATGTGVRGFGVSGSSADSRLVFWLSAILIFLDHPWFGVGLGNYKFYQPAYVNEAHDLLGFVPFNAMNYTNWAHNELLQLLCEGGIFVFLIVVFLLGCFFYQFYLFSAGKRQWPPLKLYSHLLLIPFLIQSMFSWPLRHPALLVLFFTFLGILLSQYKYETLIMPTWCHRLIRSVALFGLLIVLLVGYQEVRMGSFTRHLDQDPLLHSFSEFELLANNPYSEYPLLLNMIPRYAVALMSGRNNDYAELILPYAEKIVDLQGTHGQWFNLSLIYHFLDRDYDARQSVNMAINLWPVKDEYWNFQHYLNMREASKQTGRSLEEFLPIPPGGKAEDLSGISDFYDRIKKVK